MGAVIDSTDNGSEMYSAFFPARLSLEAPSDVESDVTDTGLSEIHLPDSQAATSISMQRPQIRRQQIIHPIHQHPEPPISSQQASSSDNSNDALSLIQLRRLVNEFSKVDATNFEFTYEDSASFEDEINEWFAYNDKEYMRLLIVKEKFEKRWRKFCDKSWLESNTSEHERFLKRELEGLADSNLPSRCKSLQTILHITLGVWDVTAQADSLQENIEAKSKVSKQHLEHIKCGINLLAKCDGIPILLDTLKNSLGRISNNEYPEHPIQENEISYLQSEIDSVTTIFYFIIEGVRSHASEMESAQKKLKQIAPDILNYFVKVTASLRWNEFNHWPQTKILLLLWKSILLALGGIAEADTLKNIVGENPQEDSRREISASPLDYHIFRQEIISKYPAYIPPPPLLPLEPDDYSILPPISSKKRRANGYDGLPPPDLNVSCSGASILHQSVHIATPAPSPPPSPPVGGKAGKKQNYQTNQNFPFLYPPLDYKSSSAGGKGIAGLQERLVGRNWVGSDIPKSILEAGDIFSHRMRMTRSLRQLWEEREKYMRFERGWDASDDEIEDFNLDFLPKNGNEEFDIDSITIDNICTHKNKNINQNKTSTAKLDCGPKNKVNDEVLQKLELVEKTYKNSLPHLQSLIIVLIKAIWTSVPNIPTPPTYHNMATDPKEVNLRANGPPTQNRFQEPSSIPMPDTDTSDFLIEEPEILRLREITIKAVSGILLLLLKWFKTSHVLKFEHMTQLLLDSNYLPLALKFLAYQDLDRFGKNKVDKDEMSFFAFCNAYSTNSPAQESILAFSDLEESEDEAVPPPIKINPNQTILMDTQDFLQSQKFEDGQDNCKRQDIEPSNISQSKADIYYELVYEFSWSTLFSTINLLRVMQKICKGKTHRNLLLVQYKSSQILKKILKFPQPEIRMFTLKLLKNQVPYYGRKWRQGNMRIITAIYLHCRPELRDDWLAGCDINADVEDALPLEQALRALTHWHNVKYYPDQMGVDTKIPSANYDFFVHELEKIEILDETSGDGDGGFKPN